MKTNNRVDRLFEETSSAYSFDNYTPSGWRGAIRMLIRRGYSDREIEAILRSKWTRWAGDASDKPYGRNTGRDLARFMDSARRGNTPIAEAVRELVIGTFGAEV